MKDSPTVDARYSLRIEDSLKAAVQDQNIEAVEYWLKQGANPNKILVISNRGHNTQRECFSILNFVSHHKDTKIAEMLLQHKAEVNFQCPSNFTPLHAACFDRNALIANFLVDNGADTNIKCKDIDGIKRSPADVWIREDYFTSITQDGITTELAENRPKFMQGI